MAEAIAKPPNLTKKFQDFLSKFNPTLPAAAELRVDLRPDLARRIAARAILEQGSQQVVVGGVGSGKTTELLAAKEAMEADVQKCMFLDISRYTDLESIKAGAILAVLGEGLRELIEYERDNVPEYQVRAFGLSLALEAAETFAHGLNPVDDESNFRHNYESFVESWAPSRYRPTPKLSPGKLSQPLPNLQRDVAASRNWLGILLYEVSDRQQSRVVVALDGLDRLRDLDAFWTLVDQDLRILRELKVSVVIVAPLLAYFTPGRDLEDRFDKTHALWSLPQESPALLDLLKRRDQDTLTAASAAEIVRYSGGVLRDLVSLARDAGEEAYLRGSPQIEQLHVDYAVQQLGLSYRRGLGSAQLKELRGIHDGGGFDLRKVEHRELLATRRLIEYSSQEFVIHPALMKELVLHDWSD